MLYIALPERILEFETTLDIWGKTLGIIGIGRIGVEVAKRANALGMDCICYDEYISESPVPDIAKMVSRNAPR